MKISTFITYVACLALFVSAHPTPEPLNEDAVSKVDKLQPIIRSLPENTRIDNSNEEKNELFSRSLKKVGKNAHKKVGKDVHKKVGKDVRKKVGKDVRKKGPHRVSKNKNLASF